MMPGLFAIGCSIKILSCISERFISSALYIHLVSEIPEQHLLSMNPHADRIAGNFNPGVQPRGTPITAEVVQGGDVDLNVTWRDARGRVASASWSKASGWDLPNPNSARRLDGRD